MLETTITKPKINPNPPEQEAIISKIYYIRGQKVMLDSDLAILYNVSVKRINEKLKRNPERFKGFAFQLSDKEAQNLRSHFATSSWGGRRYLPYAFTEHGVIMLSSVLNSDIAIKVSRQIIQIFIQLREMVNAHKELKEKIEQMERKYDQQFKVVFEAIKHILTPPEKPKKIGFIHNK